MARNLTEAAREMGVSLAALLAANPQIQNPNIATPQQISNLNRPGTGTLSSQESAAQLARVFSNPLAGGGPASFSIDGDFANAQEQIEAAQAAAQQQASQEYLGFGTIIGTPPTSVSVPPSALPAPVQLTQPSQLISPFTGRSFGGGRAPQAPQPGEGQPFQGVTQPPFGGGVFPGPGAAAFNLRTGAPSRPFRLSAPPPARIQPGEGQPFQGVQPAIPGSEQARRIPQPQPTPLGIQPGEGQPFQDQDIRLRALRRGDQALRPGNRAMLSLQRGLEGAQRELSAGDVEGFYTFLPNFMSAAQAERLGIDPSTYSALYYPDGYKRPLEDAVGAGGPVGGGGRSLGVRSSVVGGRSGRFAGTGSAGLGLVMWRI